MYLKWLKYNLPVHVNEGLTGMPRLEKNRPEGSDARTLVECLIKKNWKGKANIRRRDPVTSLCGNDGGRMQWQGEQHCW